MVSPTPWSQSTRWFYRAHVIHVIYKNYDKFLEIFDNVTEQPAGWDDESLGKFSGLLNYLDSFPFLFFSMCFFIGF